jgi:hypothetical protein
MIKTFTTNTFGGRSVSTTVELAKHLVGQPTEWWAILYIEQDGQTLKNKWGGYHCRNAGKPAYINKIWKAIKGS